MLLRRGFSLVEVVIAVGIFAGAIVVVLSLLPFLVRQSAESGELLVAQRMTDALHLEVSRRAKTVGFNALAGAVPVMSSPLENGWAWVGTSDGLRLEGGANGAGGIPQTEQFFLVELWRFQNPPLSYDASSANLPLHVRVSWPYYLPGTTGPIMLSHRSQFSFTLAVDR